MSHRFVRVLPVLVVALAAVVLVAGCGSKKKKSEAKSSGAPTVQVDKAVAAQVPAKIKAKGALKVAADATYAPNEFIGPDGHTIVGMDVDLAHALGQVMGLKLNVVNATFDSIIPGIAAHKYDLGMSSFTDTKEREKTVDFVTYLTYGTAFFVKAQGGPSIQSLADLCGHSVAVEKGTTQQDDATAQGKKCKAKGKPAPKVLVFPDQNGANLALASGRAQVGMADSPVAEYQVKKTGGQFKLSGKIYGTAPYGIAIPKGSGMAKPIQAAMKALISNGAYRKILVKWGLEAGLLPAPTINGAKS